MAQPNVAREPSMEEILASIRRIIESNDPAAARDAVAPLPPVYGGEEDDVDEAIELTVDEDMPLAYAMPAANDPAPALGGQQGYATAAERRAQPAAMPSQQQAYAVPPAREPAMQREPAAPRAGQPLAPSSAEPARPAARSVSLADLAARVRAAAERSDSAARPAPVAETPMPGAPLPRYAEPAPEQRPIQGALRGTIAPGEPARNMASAYLDMPYPQAQYAPDSYAEDRYAEDQQPQGRHATGQYAKAQLAVPPEAQPAPAAPRLIEAADRHPQMMRRDGFEAQHPPVAPLQASLPAFVEAVPQPDEVEPPAFQSMDDEGRVPGSGLDALSAGIAAEAASTALLSVAAGQQIARSFEELAAAIDGSQRRSLDEMAEAILRPMLQEWLDDNLPTLVERLVREEIERVARGPRR